MKRGRLAFELCSTNIHDVILAQQYRLDGVELCNILRYGGISPSTALLKQSRDQYSGEIGVLIRPRLGGFQYDSYEKQQIIYEIESFIDLGADTVVFACLDEHYRIDMRFMETIRSLCKSKTLCFHRAFDDIPEKETAIQQLITLGVNRLLTSGGMVTALEGIKALNQFHEWTNGKFEIMAGAGINDKNIEFLVTKSSLSRFHFSLSETISDPFPSIMELGISNRTNEQKLKNILERYG